MFKKDNHVIFHALNMWANYIETNDPTISRNDAIKINQLESIKPLDNDQQTFIIRLRTLATKHLNQGA